VIPGNNLLQMALTVIGAQTVGYRAFTGRTNNAAGKLVSTYAAAVPKRGSFQPIPRQYYAQMGLDFSKSYAMWYDPSGDTFALTRNTAGDLISFAGKNFEALSSTDWKAIDGWTGIMFVEVPT